MRSGIMLALLSAIAFGLATPFIARAGAGMSPFLVAALLYSGAGIAALALKLVTPRQGARLRREHIPRLFAAGLVGAAIAPTLLSWGLQRTGGVVGSLLLCGEPVFTALLAWRLFAEPIGARFATALGLMVVAGALLVAPTTQHALPLLGALAILGATLAWAVDNSISRALANEDPLSIVAAKGFIGAALTLTSFATFGSGVPAGAGLTSFATFGSGVPAGAGLTSFATFGSGAGVAFGAAHIATALAIAGCGAIGYGVSLRLYLDAQRRIGAGRTASVFATAPFVGAIAGVALGEPTPLLRAAGAGVLFAVAVYLHLTERHGHLHHHHALDHEHPHRHDDRHHDHTHDPPVGEHSHVHHHDEREHSHEHAPDLHHTHRHEETS